MLFWLKAGAAAAVLLAIFGYFDVFAGMLPADLRTAYGVVSQISATMLGFVLAALAILSTVANTRLLRNMQKTGHYAYLLRRMLGVTVAFGVVMICSLVSLFIAVPPAWLPYLNLGLAAAAFIGLGDICRKLWLVLSHLNPEPS